MSDAAAAGWYPDATGRHQLRYWDGTTWTDHVSDNGVAGVDPPTGGPAPTATATAPGAPPPPPFGTDTGAYSYPVATSARGPIGQPTSIGLQILLFIVTLGIWGLVWTYRQYRDFKAYSGDGIGGGLGLLIGILVSIVTYFLLPYELSSNLYAREGQQSPVSAVTGFWFLLPLVGTIIWYVKVQNAINDFWIARGAPAP